MRLSCHELDIDLHLYENTVNVLVLENPQIYSDFLGLLQKSADGQGEKIILSDDEKVFDVHKCLSIVHSPLLLELNSKRILSCLYKELKSISVEIFQQRQEELNSMLITFLDELLQHVPYPVIFDLDMDINVIFKQYNVRMECEYLSLIEKIHTFIQLEKMLCRTKVIVFIGIKAFLSEEQLMELYQVSFYNKIHLLLIEACEKTCLQYEKYYIIDKDKCVILH